MHYTRDRSPECRRTGRRTCRPALGFTMVELLVVIGIIVLLIAIALPVLSSARDAAKRATCASQLRQVGQALTAYATDNDGKFPDHGNEGNTFFNINYRSRKALGDEVMKNAFYCPSDDPQYKVGWSTPLGGVATIPPPPNTPAAQIPYITVGYVLLYTRSLGGNAAQLVPGPLPPPTHQPQIQVPPDTFPMPRPQALRSSSSLIPLACDPIKSDVATNNPVFERRAHMKSNGWPSGQNILYLDGHVQWITLVQANVQNSRGDIVPQYKDQSPAWEPYPGVTPQPVYWYEWQKQVGQ